MAPDMIAGIGAAVAMVAGSVVRAWRQAQREDARAHRAEARAASSPPVQLPIADCARHAEGHTSALARTHVRINEVLDLVATLDKRVDGVVARLDRAIDRLDDIKDWTRPTGERTKG